MRTGGDGFFHLTYCTNIHPADGWDAVFETLRHYAPLLKQRLAPDRDFGVGLRLSAREARELLAGGRLPEFRRYLDRNGLYVAILNGFPHGAFHGTRVKAGVYAPDWRDTARVDYTLDLIAVLKELLPEGLDGGISTSPLSYKPWMVDAAESDWAAITGNVARIGEALAAVHAGTGQRIHLDIEPEPHCLIENTEETLRFFEQRLRPAGEHLLDYIQVCFDCCHFAVEYERPAEALDRFASAGVKIGRVQLSSALQVSRPSRFLDRLRPFDDATYLHQVIERRGGDLRRYSDLGDALESAGAAAAEEWRIHFHVPLFVADYDGLGSTRQAVRETLDAIGRSRATRHLEIETYTWSVLPAAMQSELTDSIHREYEWVLSQF